MKKSNLLILILSLISFNASAENYGQYDEIYIEVDPNGLDVPISYNSVDEFCQMMYDNRHSIGAYPNNSIRRTDFNGDTFDFLNPDSGSGNIGCYYRNTQYNINGVIQSASGPGNGYPFVIYHSATTNPCDEYQGVNIDVLVNEIPNFSQEYSFMIIGGDYCEITHLNTNNTLVNSFQNTFCYESQYVFSGEPGDENLNIVNQDIFCSEGNGANNNPLQQVDNSGNSDIDGDGIVDNEDDDIDGDGILNFEDDDLDGDGLFNWLDDDLDGDGIKNNLDTDADGDGIDNSIDDEPFGDREDYEPPEIDEPEIIVDPLTECNPVAPTAFYTASYPCGIKGVYSDFLTEYQSTSVGMIINSFNSIPDGGQNPSFSISSPWHGDIVIEPPQILWDMIYLINIFAALALFRNVVFGG